MLEDGILEIQIPILWMGKQRNRGNSGSVLGDEV